MDKGQAEEPPTPTIDLEPFNLTESGMKKLCTYILKEKRCKHDQRLLKKSNKEKTRIIQ